MHRRGPLTSWGISPAGRRVVQSIWQRHLLQSWWSSPHYDVTEIRAAMHTHLRMMQKYFMIQRMCSRVIAKNIFKKSILHMENGGTAKKSRFNTSFLACSYPSWTPDGRISDSSPGAFGSGQSVHSVARWYWRWRVLTIRWESLHRTPPAGKSLQRYGAARVDVLAGLSPASDMP